MIRTGPFPSGTTARAPSRGPAIIAAVLACGLAALLVALLSVSPSGIGLLVVAAVAVLLVAMCWLTRTSLVGLACVLVFAGYALFNRSFADLHVSAGPLPIYVGELLLLVGLPWALLTTPDLRRLLRKPWVLALGAWLAFGAVRLLAGGFDYGINALRDSAIWYYGLFTVVGYVLLRAMPRSTWVWLLVPLFLAQTIVTAIATFTGALSLPLPGYAFDVSPTADRADIMAVNLIGGATFFLLALRTAPWPVPRVLLGMLQLGLVPLLQVRSVIVAAVAVLGIIGFQRRWSTLATVLVAPVLLVATLNVINLDVHGIRGELSVQSIVDRQLSTIPLAFQGGASTANPLTDTAAWRVYMWNTLWAETTSQVETLVFGLGFGPNLVADVGYSQANTVNAPLRSPHDIFINVLARCGVVGVVFWLLFLGVCLYAILRGVQAGRRRNDQSGVDWLLWLLAYAITFFVAALFGVVLESPFGAIPFYLIVGMALRQADDLVVGL
ncbi:MAG TPA: O-antigen ligase family protein [Chloroflexota bacterium]